MGRRIAKGPACLQGEKTSLGRILHGSETGDELDLGSVVEWQSLRCEYPEQLNDRVSTGSVGSHDPPEFPTVDADSRFSVNDAAF